MTIAWFERVLDHTDSPAELAYDDNAACRWFAARCAPVLESAAARMLADDEASAVRAAMARRADLDGELIDMLSHDTDPVVLAALASSHDLPAPIRDGMCDRVPDARVCRACGAMEAARMLDMAEGDLTTTGRRMRRGWWR